MFSDNDDEQGDDFENSIMSSEKKMMSDIFTYAKMYLYSLTVNKKKWISRKFLALIMRLYFIDQW